MGPVGPTGANGKDGLTTKVEVNGQTYEHIDGTITLDNVAAKSELFSGDYEDLVNRPTIPLQSVFASKTYVEQKVETVDDKFDGLRFKRITQEKYNALAVKDPNTLYIIVNSTGNVEENITSIYNITWTSGMNLSEAGKEITNSDQASYRTSSYVEVDPNTTYRIYTSKSSQFTTFYYNKNKQCIGHSPTVHDVGNNSGGVYQYVTNGFINTLYSSVSDDVYYIRMRTNSSDAEITIEEIGVRGESVPYTLRNGWSIVANTGVLTGGSGAAQYMMVDYIELEPYYEYNFTFKGTASSRIYLYDSDMKWIQTLPSQNTNYTATTNTVLSSSFPEGTRYIRMRTANATVGVDNAHQHFNFTKTPIKSDNVLPVNWIDGSTISSTSGSTADSSSSMRSDFITLTSGYDHLYSVLESSTDFRIFYYDSNKQFLSCGNAISSVVANQKMNVPSNAKYIRVRTNKSSNLNIDNVDDVIVIKKILAEQNLLYTFGLLSDVHVDNCSDGDFVDFGMSVRDFKNALRFIEDEGADFIAYSGDMTKANSAYNDYEKLLECLSTSNIPNYPTGGNHDVGAYYESMVNPNKYYTVEQGNDLFIYVNVKGMGVTGGVDQNTVNAIRNIIESNPNRRLFLMYHYFIRNHGSGDGNGHCSSDTLGDNYEKYPITREWADLIINTPNLIFCHGHSHMRFSSQDSYPNNNLYHADGECYSVHVPSSSVPRKINSSSLSNVEEGSEGYIVKVFTDRVEFRAVDLTTNRYLTNYTQVVNLPEGTN